MSVKKEKSMVNTKRKEYTKSNAKSSNPFDELFKETLPKQIILLTVVILILIFIFFNLDKIFGFLGKIINTLMPIIVGWVMAFIMAPIYNRLVNFFSNKEDNRIKKYAKVLSTIICVIIVIGIAIGLIFLLVPQLYNSILSFVDRANIYMNNVTSAMNDLNNISDSEFIKHLLDNIENVINGVIEGTTGINFAKIFASVYNGFYFSLKAVLNIFVGLVVMIYSLNMKKELTLGLVRIIFAISEANVAKKIIIEATYAKKVFSAFFVGKIIDSLIIGVICYICCLFMGMPYTPLIAVIVGVTNIIPFFGPFIGAIPSFVLILLEEPLSWKPYGFLIFILLLQQLDGNVIGPKILGSRTGVGSFWVLFSIILFGGLFGFVGMVIAVPTWAIITRLFNEFVTNRLKKKKYPINIEQYSTMKKIDSIFSDEET